MTLDIQRIPETFVVLTPDQSAQPVPVTPSIYQDLQANFDDFKGHVLVSVHVFSEDWKTWERHPAGDEVVMLLTGRVTLHLKTAGAETTTALTAMGEYVVIPRGLWHTAKVSEPTTMLFITPGSGTENKAE